MKKHGSKSGRRRGTWELFWEYGERKFCVQEVEYSAVLKRLNKIDPAGLTRLGYRQILNR